LNITLDPKVKGWNDEQSKEKRGAYEGSREGKTNRILGQKILDKTLRGEGGTPTRDLFAPWAMTIVGPIIPKKKTLWTERGGW